MTNIELAIWSFPVLLILVFLRAPIALAMIGVGVAGTYLVIGTPMMTLNQLKTLTYGTFSNYSFSIIPLFLLMGQFATLSGMSASLFRAAESATMGQVALPEMRRYGYPDSLSTGALAAGGTLGILIPPSVILVIYAILAEQNIAKLFVAAFIPGILAAIGYMIAISIWVRVRPNAAQLSPRVPWSKRLVMIGKIWPVILIFVAVVGGIYAGIFTPTEAAAVGAAGTFLIALFSGEMSWGRLNEAILSPWLILTIVLLMYLLFGCVMDSLSMVLLTVPIIFPIMSVLDFGMSVNDFGLWFGILVLIVVEVGLITPPVGMNLFIINAMAKTTPISETYRGALPFVVTDIIRVVILAAFPAITLWLVWVIDAL